MAIVDINALYIAQENQDNDSKKAMIYTSDSGAPYKVKVTENIAEAMGFDDVTTANSGAEALPEGFTMRKVTFSDGSGKVKGSYFVGTPTTPIYVEGGTITVARKGSITGVTCEVTGSQGERKRFLGANDTGQQSGDAS